MTFGELKACLQYYRYAEKPTITALRASTDKIVIRTALLEEPEIIVYENGYFLYRRDGHYTIAGVADCGEYCYQYPEEQVWLSEDYFDGLDWRIRLTLEGDARIQENQEHSNRKKVVSFEGFEYENQIFTDLRTPLDVVTEQEDIFRLGNAYRALLPRQRELLRKAYLYKQSLREIAAEENTSYQAIQNRLQKAIERIKKILKEGL